ncbi:flagellar hook-associated protein FlgK [Pseudomonas sp. RIT-PI-S]|uniref:flagellar hook-associated protein FlgK n=1 Tax=Pseudomonas sp. RIT-PI-S TaxID=3035295 RepID=UPI0021D8CF34|nr:flagellar hook-associated protein FlgK [Pseudomonas sp. RIT-PI-S]
MANLINIGLSGLSTSQAALTTTSNNISNVGTAGYSRQSTVSNAGALQSIGGAGYVGTGTTLAEVRRIYSSYLQNQVSSSTALDSEASTLSTNAATLDSLLSDTSTGITGVLSNFFKSLQTAAATPSDTASRQLLVTAASTLSNRFNSVASQISSSNTDINSQLTSLSDQVNTLSKSIASLNQQIVSMSGTGTPNSLMDSRDEAVRQLNELVGVTVQQRDGQYDVYLGTGQALVSGTTANSLTAQPSSSDPTQYGLTVNYASYSTEVTSVVSGGKMGGLLRYRDEVLQPAQNELGRLAIVVSDSINSQLGQGVDANGNFGSSLFSSANSDTAVAGRSQASAKNSAGSGNLGVTITNSSALTAYNYSVKFSDANTYTVTRSDGTAMGSHSLTEDPAPSIDGFTLALQGNALSAGDSFTVSPTRNGAGEIKTTMTDVSKLAFSGPLAATSSSGNSGTGSVTQPTLTTKLNVYDSTALAQAQNGIENGLPVKMVFGSASNGSQGYTLYNASGASIGSGTIIPNQTNTLNVSVPMLDDSGNPMLDANGTAMTATFQMSVSGSPAANDSYTVAFNSNGASDNRNATAVLGLQSSKTVGTTSGGGGVSMTGAYAKLVEDVGAKAAQASGDATATAAVLSSATESRDSVAGVNLDEEAADLVKFQQYYTASSQIIKTAQEVFSTLLNAL